jgi:hypothetical protein
LRNIKIIKHFYEICFLKLTKSVVNYFETKKSIYFESNILNDIHRRLTENETIILVREFTFDQILKNIYAHKVQRLKIIFNNLKNVNILIGY